MAERRLGFDPKRQLGELIPLGALWALGFAILAVAGFQSEAPIRELFLDPASLTRSPWYTGLLSNIGILCWTVAATMAVGGGWVATKTGRPSAARFMFFGALATTVLLCDDLLQIHAVWIPKLGIPKLHAQILIAFPTLIWLAVFYADLLRTRWLLAIGALGSFGVSLVIDAGFGLSGTASLMVEDGGKFLGVLAWAQYFSLTAKDVAQSTIRAAVHPTYDQIDGAPRTDSGASLSDRGNPVAADVVNSA